MISILIAASLTFTATATGVEKGAPIEFVFAGRNTDRDYETMFLIDDTIDGLCEKLERAGLPRGKPTNPLNCRLWPVGCTVSIEPSLSSFIEGKMPEGLPNSAPIYTGGTRLANGGCEALSMMPASVFSIYTLAQSPIVYNGIYEQGAVYNSFTAKKTMKKGERVTFKMSWDTASMPRSLQFTIRPGNSADVLKQLKNESEKGELDVLIDFDEQLTIAEATAAANALAVIDSAQIKINGCSNLFYRAFLPPIKWRDRHERPVQPFELTIGNPDKLLYICEDWSVEGIDPKLTPRAISFSSVTQYPKTDTCFIYTAATEKVDRVVTLMKKFAGSQVKKWYIFIE